MKKTIAALGILASLAIGSVAMATPMTWTDTVENNAVNINQGHPDYSFIYNLTGAGSSLNVLADPTNPFHPGNDLITSADLWLNFLYEGKSTKTANISLNSTATLINFTIVDKDINLNAGGIAQLNTDGTLKLDIHRIDGTFDLTDSVLTAHGVDNTPTAAPVPEPGTVALLGFGFAALGLYTRRRRTE